MARSSDWGSIVAAACVSSSRYAPVYEAAVRYGTAGKGAAWGRAVVPYVVVTWRSVRG